MIEKASNPKTTFGYLFLEGSVRIDLMLIAVE